MDFNTFSFFTNNGVGQSGLTVTCDVFSSSGSVSTNASAVDLGSGIYRYFLSTQTADDFVVIFKTSSSEVDQKQMSAFCSNRNIIPTDVWAYDDRSLTTSASVTVNVGDIWSYPSRTLTTSVARSQNSPVFMPATVELYTKSTNILTINSVTDEEEIWFTMKSRPGLTDAQSTVQISKTEGLLYANGYVPTDVGLDSTDGSVVVTSGSAVVSLSARAAPILFGDLPNSFVGELKTRTSGSIVTIITQFPINVKVALTRAL